MANVYEEIRAGCKVYSVYTSEDRYTGEIKLISGPYLKEDQARYLCDMINRKMKKTREEEKQLKQESIQELYYRRKDKRDKTSRR